MNEFFGHRLKKLRNQKKISQEKLAINLDVSQRIISNWEKSEALPSIDKIEKIALFFHVQANYLLGQDNKTLEIIQNLKIAFLNNNHTANDAYEEYLEHLKKETEKEIAIQELKTQDPEAYVEARTEQARYNAAKEVGLLSLFFPDEEPDSEHENNFEKESVPQYDFDCDPEKRLENIALPKELLKQIYDIDPD